MSRITSTRSITKRKGEELCVKEFLSAVDETPDFHDPFSDLNLFLSQKIKQVMQHESFGKKWSQQLQDNLVAKITPDFQKKFPQYRLGIAALRKTWEKIAYYAQQIQSQKGAISQDGKLNIHFFIKENLRRYAANQSPSDLPPYHYAHQLAVKLSECIAAIDGTRPKLDELTKTIWAVYKHLVSGLRTKSPYDEYDKIDKLIVKTLLEITAKEPQISHNELQHKVKESLQSLHDLPSFASLESITCNIAALLAEKLYPSSPLKEQAAILNFVRRQTALCKSSSIAPHLPDLVRRTLALYSLACHLPKNLSEEAIREAILSMYPNDKEPKPDLPQAIFAFISAELVLMKTDEYCRSVDYVVEAITKAYQETQFLPVLQGKECDHLEVLIWKVLSEKEGLLEKLPYRIGHRIEEEIAGNLIDNPHQSFSSVVHQTASFFQKTKELALHNKWSEIDRKIHLWTIQGDMLCRFIRFDSDAPLLQLIQEKLRQAPHLPHAELVSEISQAYLKKFPELAPYSPQLIVRIWILYKYSWYNQMPETSSFNRFLKWHASHAPHTTDQQLEDLCKKVIPLFPFDPQQKTA